MSNATILIFLRIVILKILTCLDLQFIAIRYRHTDERVDLRTDKLTLIIENLSDSNTGGSIYRLRFRVKNFNFQIPLFYKRRSSTFRMGPFVVRMRVPV